MIHLDCAVVVEGKYDRARLASLIDAPILQTDGFGIFRDKELCALIRRYADTCGILVLTDSDSAGKLIRGRIASIVGNEAKVTHLYIPKIEGKERRKTAPSKEGLLGVEGMDTETLSAVFSRYRAAEKREREPLTRADLYELMLFGAPDSAARRAALLRSFDLPEDLGVNRMLDALSFLVGRTQVYARCRELFTV